jgi:hypothetical protein
MPDGRSAARTYRAQSESRAAREHGRKEAHVMTFADKWVISKFAAPQKIIFVEALG